MGNGVKGVWHIDCFRYRTNPEECDPRGCGSCKKLKELEELFNDTRSS